MAQEKKHRASKHSHKNGPVETKDEAMEERKPGEEQPEEQVICPIVGVGASAGGLEALQGLLAGVPGEPAMTFVIVQHRAADRTSVMKSLLEKHTTFDVVDIEDNMAVKAKTIYLAPPDRDVSIRSGTLYLSEPRSHSGLHLPVDAFLRTLAQDQTERAVGIILSGTGSDGTLGIKEIKAAGGMVMAQDEEQAKYDSMPRSAIDTGMVDFVLPVEKMGGQLAQYIRHPLLKPRKIADLEKDIEDQLQRIFVLIRSETGHDFSHYKRSTVQRRIARRLAIHQIENLDHYIKLLQENHQETHILAREMLITVTNFFRDPAAFESLHRHVIRPLVEHRPADTPIRVWVPACATGEEPYSIAILLSEEMEKARNHYHTQIFATDIDEDSIDTARRGQYPKSIAADVSPSRLKRYFTEEENHYRVRNGIREMVVFAKHSLIKDPPFSKLDLISCRNVLIYMDTTLQQKLIPMFHYSLNRGGHLFLGESESIGTFADLFAPTDSKHKLFKRKPAEVGYEPEAEIGRYPRAEEAKDKIRPARPQQDLSKVAEKVILRDYSLPCVLVDEQFNIVHFNGDTSRYLTLPAGRPTFDILQMVRPAMLYRLEALLKQVFREKRRAVEKDFQIRDDNRFISLDIEVRPVMEPGVGGNLALVIFRGKASERPAADGDAGSVALPEQAQDARIHDLEQELQSTKEHLQTTVEEFETSNEELKASNEELQSMNEELQSTNEELDTSREELQSTNEELRTINSEHQQKIDELSRAYDDMNNLLAATDVATLFLGPDLRIRRFTPAARKLFRLMDRDVGRPIEDIASSLRYDSLFADIHKVMETLARIDKEIQVEGGAWYQMKIVPYRTAENVIEGTVATFIDIDLQRTTGFAQAIVETAREPLLILDDQLHVLTANPAFYRHFQVDSKDTLGQHIYDLGTHQWDIPELRDLLERIVPQNTRFEDFKVTHTFPRIGTRTILLNARQTLFKGETTGRILLAMEDVTDYRHDDTETEKGPDGKSE